jgi:hypothetical protein
VTRPGDAKTAPAPLIVDTERALTDEERRKLERLARRVPDRYQRWREVVVNAGVMTFVSMGMVLAPWLLLAWLVRKSGGPDIGVHSAVAPWIVGIGLPLAAGFAIVSTLRWMRAWGERLGDIDRDLAAGRVREEHHAFVAAKRFQEQEHGGLVYFLRSADDRVYVIYDRHSQELGMDGDDPLSSPFRAREQLTIVRTPLSGRVLRRRFSGAVLTAGEVHDLTAAPADWPEDDGYCTLAWDELEARLH